MAPVAGVGGDARTPQKRSVGLTVRWYLSFCAGGRGGVCRQSARDFIAWAGHCWVEG